MKTSGLLAIRSRVKHGTPKSFEESFYKTVKIKSEDYNEHHVVVVALEKLILSSDAIKMQPPMQ